MSEADKPRRDFLFLATGAVAALGGVAIMRPLFGHMAPAADRRAAKGPIIDLSLMEEGQQLKLLHKRRPIGIRYRTSAEIMAAQLDDDTNLPDPEKDVSRLKPKPDGSYDPRFLVFDLRCTHFGCVVVGEAGEYDGWYCPCHGGHFDTSGRIRKGPPPKNLRIPDYYWSSDTAITFREPTFLNDYGANQL